MKKTKLSLIILLILGIVIFANAQDKKVTVLGTVADTAGNPIDSAIVLITKDSISVNPEFDTAYTGSDGNFSKEITVNDNAIGIRYAVSKKGYQTKWGYGQITGNTCNLGTIVLYKSGSGTRTIHVFGSVYDQKTDLPVNEALVMLSTSGNIVDPPESTYTGTDGTFYKAMEIDSSGVGQVAPLLVYRVEKDGYNPANGSERIQKDTVDLGKITIMPDPMPIENGNPVSFTVAVPNNIAIYSIKGQLIYTGFEMNLDKLIHLGIISQSQPIIITYKLNNEVLFRKKIASVR